MKRPSTGSGRPEPVEGRISYTTTRTHSFCLALHASQTKNVAVGRDCSKSPREKYRLIPNRPGEFGTHLRDVGMPALLGVGIVIEHEKNIATWLHGPPNPTVQAKFV